MTKGKPNNWRDKEFSRLKRVRDSDWYWWVDKKPRNRRKRRRYSGMSEYPKMICVACEEVEIPLGGPPLCKECAEKYDQIKEPEARTEVSKEEFLKD